MTLFKKGDILWGKRREFDEAWHPIVYMGGPSESPLAVVLTHESAFQCNIPLTQRYGEKQSYFIAHLIEKMSEWGPYMKSNRLELSKRDLEVILAETENQSSVTWDQYMNDTKDGCVKHKKISSREGSL